jgi:hypothetical protein
MVGCSSQVHLSISSSQSCAATNCLTSSGPASRPCSVSGPESVRWAGRRATTARSSMVSFGSCTPARPGVTSLSATGPGRPCSPDSMGGVGMALGPASLPRCWTNWTTRARSITTCGASTGPSSGPAGPPPGGGKKGERFAAAGRTQAGATPGAA